MRDRQRQIMRDENLALMNQRKQNDQLDREQGKSLANTSPVQIGEGYKRQLAAMQAKDR